MGTQGTGRKRIPNREKMSAEDDALSQIAREAEARLAAKRAARAEAREIRLKELERQQKEIYQTQRKYYGLDSKWGHIEQWMEDSERYSRHSRKHTSISDDEERMSVGSRGSLRGTYSDLCGSTGSLPSSRLHNGRPTDYGGFLGSGSRASSRASSARASPVVEERSDFLEKGSRTASTLSAATLASLGGGFSRRGSCDTSISVDTEASMREIKDSLVEAEEKYRKAMVSNAQLDNEKSNLMYQVDTLRDTLMELEELLYETRRECEEKTKECDRERHAHSVLQFQFDDMKETLKQNEELLKALERQKEYSDIIRDERDALRDEVYRLRDALKKHGISLGSEVTANGETGSNMTNGPERVESGQDTPAMSADSILERSPEDQVPEMDSTSCMEEKSRMITHAEVKRAEDMDSSSRASCSIVQIQEDGKDPETNEFKKRQSVCVGNLPDVTVQESVVAQNEGIFRVGKHVNRQNEQVEEPWIEENTRDTEVPERPLTRDVNEARAPSPFIKTNDQLTPTTSHTNQADEETLEKMELPGTTKSYEDPRKPIPSMDVEMTSTRRGDVSSSSEQESETELELESGNVQSCLFTIPVEEKGIASFLDSCQEASALDFEVIRLNETDEAGVEHQEETSPAGDDTKHNRMRLRNKRGQDCSVS
ncbi:leucine-rich repeat flightless-interacting protein 1 isoform X6 [Pangasianodon hypophthalmus]|uniref:leucine-rich repeat flightless-interacting protein 1 isoform X6 n=1 Tax=Pangasianodon hypophthalmus TaxID=310915 RepID=UPI0023075A9A|nr:leucine-rich repeat flightless-interacting protein 1 isoform X6 [Pangasianodon hypophthalmus]